MADINKELLSIYEKALTKMQMKEDGECYISMCDLDEILREYSK